VIFIRLPFIIITSGSISISTFAESNHRLSDITPTNMKTTPLNLLILDKNSMIIGPLSTYLNTRFGERISISPYSNTEECILYVDKKSHVIILDYFLNHEDRSSTKGLKVFESIKKRKPGTKITLLTSREDIEVAIEEMEQGASKYIMKNERGLYDIRFVLDKAVKPLKTVVFPIITLPIRKLVHYYTIKAYLMMFFVAFISVGALVVAGYLGLKFAHFLNL
jgi:ActR/RegA family two-component response regulator